jgi:RES domain-containing protein
VVTAEIPDGVSRISICLAPSRPDLELIGDRFASNGRAAILIVPSALAPTESNWLLNPRHSEFSKIRPRSVEPFDYDRRFFK